MCAKRVADRIVPLVCDTKSGTHHIRNIAVIAHVDHGKTTLTDSLCVKAGLIGSANGRRYMDSRPDEQDRTITIKSSSVSMPFAVPSQWLEPKTEARMREEKIQAEDWKKASKSPSPSRKNASRYDSSKPIQWRKFLESKQDAEAKTQTKTMLVNLIDSPGHADFTSEVSAALRLTDGAVVVMDCAKGVCVQTRTVVRQALTERVRPVAFLNKLDKMFTRWPSDPETCYRALEKGVQDLNIAIGANEEGVMGKSCTVWPQNGSVGFGSGLQGWGFTLRDFARIYHDRHGISERKMMKKLWGEHFYDPKRKKWSTTRTKNNIRGFCWFVLRPITNLYNACISGDASKIAKWTKRVCLDGKIPEGLKSDKLFAYVIKQWMPAANALVEMIAVHLPSPVEAAEYRLPVVYSGPQDDECARAIKKCDPDGPLMLCISKMVPSAPEGSVGAMRFWAFGRIFSGTLRPGDQVRILSSDYIPGRKHGSCVRPAPSVSILMGARKAAVGAAGPGAVVAVGGIDRFMRKRATLTTSQVAHSFAGMRLTAAAVVRTAVHMDSKQKGGREKLALALNALEQSDPLVKVVRSKESGEFIVCACGSLHLEICIKDLKGFLGSKALGLIVSDPIVSYRETLAGPAESVISKSPNGHNRLHVKAKPLDREIVKAVTDPESGSSLSDPMVLADDKKRARALVSELGWNPTSAKKVWSLSTGESVDAANLLADESKGAQHLHEVKEAIIDGFHQGLYEGAIAGEPLSGVHLSIEDVKLHGDSAHRGSRQIGSMAKGALYAAQLEAGTRILEPVFLVSVSAAKEAEANVYKALHKAGASIVDANAAQGMVDIKAHLPVRMSTTFPQDLSSETRGEAQADMVFSHWDYVKGDPHIEGTEARMLVDAIRKRKGMTVDLPKSQPTKKRASK
ncbi:hypothetical protein AAMO2058_001174300 [Amorphochlora amoebiformis]